MKRTLLATYLSLTAIFGAIAFLSNPEYYRLAAVTVLLVIAAYLVISERGARKLLLISYVVVAVASYLIGQTFFSEGRLDETGKMIVYGMIPFVLLLIARIFVIEKRLSDEIKQRES